MELLLSKLDKDQLVDFLRKECENDGYLRDRFLALGAGTLFKPKPETYVSRVRDLIRGYGGRHRYIEYRATSDFNRSVTRILDEATDAMASHQWEVAFAVLLGISAISEEILDSGDDSSGELGGIVSDCFYRWQELCEEKSLPENIKSRIFELALIRFNEKDLEGWDWWWSWMEMAIELANTPEKQNRVFKALEAIKPEDDSFSSRYNTETAQKNLSLCHDAELPKNRISTCMKMSAIPIFEGNSSKCHGTKAITKKCCDLPKTVSTMMPTCLDLLMSGIDGSTESIAKLMTKTIQFSWLDISFSIMVVEPSQSFPRKPCVQH